LVWSGRATKTLDPKANQEKKQKNLDKADGEIAEQFPTQIERNGRIVPDFSPTTA
jgi:hypothetical protein